MPDHPGALSQVRTNGYTLPVHGNGLNKTASVEEPVGLEELVKSNKFLILAAQADGQEPYVFALEELNHLLQDTILLVADVIGFTLLYSGRLKVKDILKSNLSPTASGLDDDKSAVHFNDIKGKPDLDLEEADPAEDVKVLLHDLAGFGARFPRQEISLEAVPPLSLQERRPIESFDDIAKFDKRDTPVVTMFSGGLDSTYLLLRLQRLGFTNIHAVAVDVGAAVDEDVLTKHAASFGAKFKCLDGRELFVKEGVMPAIRAHAKYLGMYPISSSLTRPFIARLITDYAKGLNAGLLLHTANLSQNSLPRLNNGIRRYGFSGEFGSPYVHSVVSREKKAEELAAVGLTIMSERKLSADENLWCREFEDGPLGDPESFSIPEDAYEWTRRRKDETTEKLTLSFKNGNLVSVNDNKLPLIEAIALLNTEVGKFGHGRFVGLEPLSTDHKALEIREAPAAAIIMDALRHLEVATLDTKSLELKQHLEQQWVREAISGHWGGTCHTMCDAAIASALNGVDGSITYVIDHTRYLPCSIVARNPRYIRDRDQWEHGQQLLGGFHSKT